MLPAVSVKDRHYRYRAIVAGSIFRIRFPAVILLSGHTFDHVGHDLIELGRILGCNDRGIGLGLNIFPGAAGYLSSRPGSGQILLESGWLPAFFRLWQAISTAYNL